MSLDPNYVASNKPVNLRTSAKQAPPPITVSPMLHGRIASLKNKHRFGPPLIEQLRAAPRRTAHTSITPSTVVAAMLVTTSSVAALLAGIQQSLSMASLAGAGLVFGVGLAWYAYRKSAPHSTPHQSGTLFFDEASLLAFDRALAQVGEALPADIAQQLHGIKQQIVRIAQFANQTALSDAIEPENKHYLRETLQRYLPDSLQSYLLVPAPARASQLITAHHTADDLLRQQLLLLSGELDKRESKLTKIAAEQLVLQQRFLEEKSS